MGLTVRRTGRLGRWASGRAAARRECHRERGGGWQRQQNPGVALVFFQPGGSDDHCFSPFYFGFPRIAKLTKHRASFIDERLSRGLSSVE
jgi:hypothetical protein